jgi:hypothetical protein
VRCQCRLTLALQFGNVLSRELLVAQSFPLDLELLRLNPLLPFLSVRIAALDATAVGGHLRIWSTVRCGETRPDLDCRAILGMRRHGQKGEHTQTRTPVKLPTSQTLAQRRAMTPANTVARR